MAGAKKVVKIKKIVFFMPVNHAKEFVLYFYNFWPELQMAAITPGDKIFD